MARAVIVDESYKVKRIEDKDFSVFNIVPDHRQVRINDVLPFRVKFINIGVEGVNPNTVPPIPLQVIGYSNYIL
jgi:hypothetical protein